MKSSQTGPEATLGVLRVEGLVRAHVMAQTGSGMLEAPDIFVEFALPENVRLCAIGLEHVLNQGIEGQDLKSGSVEAFCLNMAATGLLGLAGTHGALTTSLQTVTRGALRNVYGEVDQQGHMRGFALPPDAPHADLGPGQLSVVRTFDKGEPQQGAIPLVDLPFLGGVEDWLSRAGQIESRLWAHRQPNNRTVAIMLEYLPDTAPETAASLASKVEQEALCATWSSQPIDAAMWQQAFEGAVSVRHQELVWQCRCSRERAERALRMLERTELDEMISTGETAESTCHFCGAIYRISPDEIASLAAGVQ